MSKVAIVGFGFRRPRLGDQFRPRRIRRRALGPDPEAPARALSYIAELLPDLEQNDLLNAASATAVGARMRPAARLDGGA